MNTILGQFAHLYICGLFVIQQKLHQLLMQSDNSGSYLNFPSSFSEKSFRVVSSSYGEGLHTVTSNIGWDLGFLVSGPSE